MSAEHGLQDRILAWSTKEKQIEVQAHLQAQQHLATEHQELIQTKLSLQVPIHPAILLPFRSSRAQSEQSRFERERREWRSTVEREKEEHRSMCDRLRQAQENVCRLRENEGILINRLRRMQSEMAEFQKALLASYHVPVGLPLLPAASGIT